MYDLQVQCITEQNWNIIIEFVNYNDFEKISTQWKKYLVNFNKVDSKIDLVEENFCWLFFDIWHNLLPRQSEVSKKCLRFFLKFIFIYKYTYPVVLMIEQTVDWVVQINISKYLNRKKQIN